MAVNFTGINISYALAVSPDSIKLISYTILWYGIFYVLIEWFIHFLSIKLTNAILVNRINDSNYLIIDPIVNGFVVNFMLKLGFGKNETNESVSKLNEIGQMSLSAGVLFLQSYFIYSSTIFIVVFLVLVIVKVSSVGLINSKKKVFLIKNANLRYIKKK